MCIKDMAGLLAPYDVYELVKTLKKTVKIPIQLHTHYTSGMASMTYLKAIEAGVDIIGYGVGTVCLEVLAAGGGADCGGVGGDALGYGVGSFEAVEVGGVS